MYHKMSPLDKVELEVMNVTGGDTVELCPVRRMNVLVRGWGRMYYQLKQIAPVSDAQTAIGNI